MSSKYVFTTALLVVLSLSQTACFLPPECDPASDDYDLEECRFESGYYSLLANLTNLAYGDTDYDPPESSCPTRILCSPKNCTFAGENGDFKDFEITPWTGDKASLSFLHCDPRNGSLEFDATTPDGASSSISSQVFQIIDYNKYVPEGTRNIMRRVRAQAAFNAFPISGPDDNQFGLRIEAYHGDIAAFPTSGDPEQIPRETPRYRRLGFSEATLFYDSEEEARWQPLRTHLMLPPDSTTFLVVLLEALENTSNESTTREFFRHLVTNVQVIIDAGPYPPTARDDEATTTRNEPVTIRVLANDSDPDDILDRSTVRVVVPPPKGTAVVDTNGTITYAPSAGFIGTDQFNYAFSDWDGFTAGALVTVEVVPGNRPPVANPDTFDVILGTSTELDLLANDSDPDGDPIAIIASSPRTLEGGTTEVIDGGQAVRYEPDEGFTGTDSFNYVITDNLGGSSRETPVTVIVANGNRPPAVTAPINDLTVSPDPPTSCSFDLDDHFADPDGDALTYSASQSGGNATVTLNGSNVSISGSGLNQAMVTITAEDPEGLMVSDMFVVQKVLSVTDCGGNRLAR